MRSSDKTAQSIVVIVELGHACLATCSPQGWSRYEHHDMDSIILYRRRSVSFRRACCATSQSNHWRALAWPAWVWALVGGSVLHNSLHVFTYNSWHVDTKIADRSVVISRHHKKSRHAFGAPSWRPSYFRVAGTLF